MKYNPQIHHRRSIRLPGYDYSQAGAYFVTICTYAREPLLATGVVQEAVLSAWQAIPGRFLGVALDEFVIMPNHVHGILVFADPARLEGAASQGEGAASRAPTRRPTLGDVILAFKSVSAIAANAILNRKGFPFWQRNYYEHIARDDAELNAIRQYIRDNPLNWDQDPDNPSNL